MRTYVHICMHALWLYLHTVRFSKEKISCSVSYAVASLELKIDGCNLCPITVIRHNLHKIAQNWRVQLAFLKNRRVHLHPSHPSKDATDLALLYIVREGSERGRGIWCARASHVSCIWEYTGCLMHNTGNIHFLIPGVVLEKKRFTQTNMHTPYYS